MLFTVTNKGTSTLGFYVFRSRMYDKNGNFIAKDDEHGFFNRLEPGESQVLNNGYDSYGGTAPNIGKIDIIASHYNSDHIIEEEIYTFTNIQVLK